MKAKVPQEAAQSAKVEEAQNPNPLETKEAEVAEPPQEGGEVTVPSEQEEEGIPQEAAEPPEEEEEESAVGGLVDGVGSGGLGFSGTGLGGGAGGGGAFGTLGGINHGPDVAWSGEVTLSGAGALDADAISEVLFDADGMESCAAVHFENAPPDAIEIDVQFTVGANGVVSRILVQTEGLGADVLKCIEEHIEVIEGFAEPEGGDVVVNTAMLFEP